MIIEPPVIKRIWSNKPTVSCCRVDCACNTALSCRRTEISIGRDGECMMYGKKEDKGGE